MTGRPDPPSPLAVLRETARESHKNDPHPTEGTVLWPILTTVEAIEEWPKLLAWVELLRVRFPNAVRLPDCWWQHNDLVEALSALRDYERACYAPHASSTAPVDWHRAFRDIEARIEVWIRRFTCTVPGRGHPPAEANSDLPAGWQQHLDADLATRHTPPPASISPASGPPAPGSPASSPTPDGLTADA
jgi:hypothetical protein